MQSAEAFLGKGGCRSSAILNKAGKGPNSTYGGLPVISYITVHPSDQTSLLGFITSCPFTVYGAIQ